jgi:DNA mismatch repair protein MutL
MEQTIQPLKTELVRRMAAGEVIDSLAAVVRELIENALDASATRLSISLWPELDTVEVSDNGLGLTWDNLHRAALPHTTSKITAFEHLSHLTTLGFRGEALHSLAQLGQLEIRSRAITADTGWHVGYDAQGAVVFATELAMAPGTIVTVTHLFQTWPSRQESPPAPLLRHIQDLVGDYALGHPHVTWQLYQNERPWFTVAPGATAQEILPQLLRKVSPEALRYDSFTATVPLPQDSSTNDGNSEGAGTIRLLVGLPDRYHRHRPDWIRVAVNGRRAFINAAIPDLWGLGPLEQKLLATFRQTLPRHRYPLCWVHLQVPSTFVDWHRTAAKSQIYLHALENWSHQITQRIQAALDLQPMGETTTDVRIRQILKSAEAKGKYHLSIPRSLSDPLPSETITTAEQPLGELRAIAQLHQTYIVAEHPAGLWLVEQHIAHERVLYEQLVQDCQFIALETPLPLNDLSEQQVQNLTHLGFGIEPFGQNLWAIRTVPSLLAQRPDCQEVLYELSHCATLQPALVATACRSAIRNGETLTLGQMQTLLDAWQQTKQPRTCPHGRPIYLRLDEPALAKFFRRRWVVGKR